MINNDLQNLSTKLENLLSDVNKTIAYNKIHAIDLENKESLIKAIAKMASTRSDMYNCLVNQINDGTLIVSGTKSTKSNFSGDDVYNLRLTLENQLEVIINFISVHYDSTWSIENETVEVVCFNEEKSQVELIELLRLSLLDEVSSIASSVAFDDQPSYSFVDTPEYAEFDHNLCKAITNTLAQFHSASEAS